VSNGAATFVARKLEVKVEVMAEYMDAAAAKMETLL
jgi:hypothetical protein